MFLEPIKKNELEEIFDNKAKQILAYYFSKAIFFHPETLPHQKSIPLQFPKEYLEQWVAQAVNGQPIGSGSYPVDIVHQDGWAADIKSLSWSTNKYSGETSLAQNFKGIGQQLDGMFKNAEFDQILNGWIGILEDKYEKVFADNEGVRFIYYFFILRESYNFHLLGLKLNFKDLCLASPGNYTKTNLTINDFIDNKIGDVCIYKSKKRMELRLIPEEWKKRNLMLNFSNNIVKKQSLLRDMSDDELFKDNFLLFNKLFGK